MIAIEEIPRALIPDHAWSGILRQQLGATMTTAQQPSEQRLTVFDRSAHRVTPRIVVVGNHRLIALIDIPVNVTLMVIQDQYCPVLATALHLSTDLLLPGLKPHHGLAAPVRVCSGIDRVLQHAEHRVVPSGQPDDRTPLFWPANDRQLNMLPIKPEIDLPHAAQLRKFAKDQIDSGPHPGIRIFLDTVVRSFDVPDRDPSNQGAPLRLLQQRRVRTLAETRDFHLADRALHAQQQSVVRESGVIYGFGVDQQRTDDTAKLQQGMPVPAIARQPRRLNAEDGAHLPIAKRAQQAFKAGAVCSRSRNPQIVIDNIDVLPAQRARMIDKGILAPLAFKIVLHLTRRGLTDVHTSPPGQMVSGDLAHRRPPRGSSWPVPASTAPAPGVAAVARPVEVVRRERRAVPRRVLVGILLGAAASWSSSCTLCALGERHVTVTRRNSSSTRTGRRAAGTIFACAASGRVIQAGTANGVPSARRTT